MGKKEPRSFLRSGLTFERPFHELFFLCSFPVCFSRINVDVIEKCISLLAIRRKSK